MMVGLPHGPRTVTIRTKLRRLRLKRRLTHQQLSGRLQFTGHPLSPNVVSKIENGQRRIDVDDLEALAAALEVDVWALWGDP